VIERVVVAEPDETQHHWITTEVIDLYRVMKPTGIVHTMQLLYAANRCLMCRRSLVDIFVQENSLPDWMAEECLWDANLDTREAVRAYFAQRA